MDGQVIALGTETDELASLLDVLFAKYHYDFRGYSKASLRRRLRTALTHFDCESIAMLEARLLRDPTLFPQLIRFLTVQVSDLFRDPAYFSALRDEVVPHLRTYSSLRVWVAGCATGEEAYSLAILLHEEGLLERTTIYATDIAPESLRVAEHGIFDASRFAKFSANYQRAGGRASLADYYTARYSSAVFDRRLRRSILFCDHSLATDSVFGEMQLISCRNVLIYFDHALQDRALGVLYDSLCTRGFLGLGEKETLRFSTHADGFLDLVPEQRIYRRQ